MNEHLYVKSTESDSFREALGISEERCIELCGLIQKIHSAHNDYSISDLISEASKHCENANELAFVSFIAGTHARPMKAEVNVVMGGSVPPEIKSIFERMMRQKTRGAMHPFGEN